MISRRRFLTAAALVTGSAAVPRFRALADASEDTAPASPGAPPFEELRLPDGRFLEYIQLGAKDGVPLVCHHGTPSSALTYGDWGPAASAAGLRVIATSRAGYGLSTRMRGRDVAQVVGDITALLDHLGADTFLTTGWSGGGPHALACAALLPDRCLGAATLAGVGAYGADDLDFLDGMAEENHAEFNASLEGEETIASFLAENYEGLKTIPGPELAAAFGGLVSEPDKAALTDAFAEGMAASFRWALHAGFDGWVDDDLAFVRPWGFDLAAIRVPVTVWQGRLDYMVPGAHGEWLSRHVPGARLRIEPGQGHLSLVSMFLPSILADLREMPGRGK